MIRRIAVSAVVLAAVLSPAPAAPAANHTYGVVYDANASWTMAQAAAASAGGYLVSITSAEEQALVECLIEQSNPPQAGAFWIGLHEVSSNVYGWENGETFGYDHWYENEPNDAGGVEDSGQLLWSSDPGRRGWWNDAPDAGFTGETPPDINRMGYVIEADGAGLDSIPCVCVWKPNEYQVVHDADISWEDARTAALNAGGFLVTITSAAEQLVVQTALSGAVVGSNFFFGGYWIGLKETANENEYVWDNGEPLGGYVNWYHMGEPNNSGGIEDRGQIMWTFAGDRLGAWNDVPEVGYATSESEGVARAGYIIEYGCPDPIVRTSSVAPGVSGGLSVSAFPNPARAGALRVRYSLPAAEPASLELLDLAGRRVAVRYLPAATGAQVVSLAEGARFAPGLYFARLRQGHATQVARVVVTR